MTPEMPMKIRIGRYSSSSRSIYPFSPPLFVFRGCNRPPRARGGLEQDSSQENRIFRVYLRAILREKMAGATGLEPATYGVTGRHSNQLSYAPAGARGAHPREGAPMYG